MDFMNPDVFMFFDQHQGILPLYEAFAGKLMARFPDTKMKMQKTQITFSNRHVYACISFLRVKKKTELPASYFVLTLGLVRNNYKPYFRRRMFPLSHTEIGREVQYGRKKEKIIGRIERGSAERADFN